MRVKLSYTVEEDAVLTESAKLVNLASDDMQHAIFLFNETQKVLKGEEIPDHKNVDVHRALEMIDDFRKALLNVDTRLSEVVEIVEAYDEYQREQRSALPSASPKPRPKGKKE